MVRNSVRFIFIQIKKLRKLAGIVITLILVGKDYKEFSNYNEIQI